MSVVQLTNLNFSFYDKKRDTELQILRNVNLQVEQGEFHLITGPSGSGKTTLLQIIGTILQQKEGKREIFSKEISPEPAIDLLAEIRKQIGYLFQTPYLPPHLTVSEFIEMQSSLSGKDIETAERQALSLLEQFNIESFKKSKPIKMSGGEKQRVAIAGIMAKDVRLLLLDEPTGSLDYDNRVIIWDLISQLKSKNLAIIVVSHDETIAEFADVSHKLDNGIIKKL
jgi:putative ABC transport system ATP-binding protein